MGSTVLIPNATEPTPVSGSKCFIASDGPNKCAFEGTFPYPILVTQLCRHCAAGKTPRHTRQITTQTSTVQHPAPYTQTPTPTYPHSTRGNRPIIGSAQGAHNPAASPTGILQAGRSAPVRPGSYHRRCSGLTDRLSQMECPAPGPEAGSSGALFNGVSDEVPRVWGGGGTQRGPGRRRRRAA